MFNQFMNSFDNVPAQKAQDRTKLWQLDHNYHCAVIGTCLTMDEVRKLLRSLRVDIHGVNSYDIHTSIVTLISYNDSRSKKVQSYLNKKFKSAIQKSKKMNAAELVVEWKRVVDSGELIGTFWALISHPCTNEQMKRDFYGDIHMQSHMSGACNRADLKRLKHLEKDHKVYNVETRTQQIKYQKLQVENNRLQAVTQQQDEKTIGLNNQVSALTNVNEQLMAVKSTEEIQQLNFQVDKLSNKISFQTNDIQNHQQNSIRLEKEVFELNNQLCIYEKTSIAYKNEIEHLQYTLSQKKSEEECLFKKQGLCGQCVLYVGGKSNLVPYYRELIEAKKGVFMHHDGGIEKNTQDLSNSINRADVVLFPSDCISHDAYWKIKQTCKKQQKPFEYLQSPGLHSLSSILDKIVLNDEEVDYVPAL